MGIDKPPQTYVLGVHLGPFSPKQRDERVFRNERLSVRRGGSVTPSGNRVSARMIPRGDSGYTEVDILQLTRRLECDTDGIPRRNWRSLA